jgi:hypothetical protein
MAIPTIALIPSGYKSGKVYSALPTDGTGDLTFTRASSATRINKDGLLETVVTGVPRLDYLNTDCPDLLIEPQSTNLHLHSEDMTNAYYTKSGLTAIANNSISPKGDLTMDLLRESSVSESHNLLTATSTITANVVQTLSVFFKKEAGSAQRYLRLDLVGNSFSNGGRSLFDIETGTIALAALNIGTGTLATSKIENYGNGIYRASLSVNLNGGITVSRTQVILQDQKTSYTSTYLGDGVSGVNIWGMHLESLPYATSYVQTVSSIATRLADKAFKTGLSSYINSTEGSFEFNCKLLGNQTDSVRFSLSDGTTDNRISLALTSTNVTVFSILSASGNASISYNYSFTDFTNFKISWTSTLMSLFVNDIEVATSSITTAFTSNLFNRIGLDTGSASDFFLGRIKEIKIYS